jgi:hypothetical protein
VGASFFGGRGFELRRARTPDDSCVLGFHPRLGGISEGSGGGMPFPGRAGADTDAPLCMFGSALLASLSPGLRPTLLTSPRFASATFSSSSVTHSCIACS